MDLVVRADRRLADGPGSHLLVPPPEARNLGTPGPRAYRARRPASRRSGLPTDPAQGCAPCGPWRSVLARVSRRSGPVWRFECSPMRARGGPRYSRVGFERAGPVEAIGALNGCGDRSSDGCLGRPNSIQCRRHGGWVVELNRARAGVARGALLTRHRRGGRTVALLVTGTGWCCRNAGPQRASASDAARASQCERSASLETIGGGVVVDPRPQGRAVLGFRARGRLKWTGRPDEMTPRCGSPVPRTGGISH